MTRTSFVKKSTKPFRETQMGRFLSRRRPQLRLVIVGITLPSLFLLTLVFDSHGQNQTKQPPGKLTPAQKAKIPELRNVSKNIRRVSEILNAEGVQIEAGLLFTPNGRKKARPQLEAYPDMYLSKTQTGPLRGVLMADNLTLPEKVKIGEDTVIIAKHLNFTGRAPVIKGPHDLHLFVLDSAKTNGPGTVITIDTSGLGRDEWLESQRQQVRAKSQPRKLANHATQPYQASNGMDGIMGTVGASGSNGNHGTAGSNGSCSAVKNGSTGTSGTAGMPGGNGGNGTDGTPGQSAGNQTITITNINAGAFNVTVKGGAGGAGGAGGFGGIGGTGGNGGGGGNGASCSCANGGLGIGGNGGNAGAGGNGGNGGRGGNGANGGSGGNVIVSFPWGYDFTQVSINNQGGAAGPAGLGGQASVGGSAGSPGLGGHGGSVFGCDTANTGTAGNPASGGAGGSGGNGGSAGQPGTPGSTNWNMTGGPDEVGGGSEKYGWEPGATYGSCTEWFLVSFHCEMLINSLPPRKNKVLTNHTKYFPPIFSKWSCVETGRMYIGCY